MKHMIVIIQQRLGVYDVFCKTVNTESGNVYFQHVVQLIPKIGCAIRWGCPKFSATGFVAQYENSLVYEQGIPSDKSLEMVFSNMVINHNQLPRVVQEVLFESNPKVISPNIPPVLYSPTVLRQHFRGQAAPRGYTSPILYPMFQSAIQKAYFALGATALYGSSLLIPGGTSFAAPIICSLYIGAYIYLIGLSYGIINDMFACRTNIEYFTEGHNDGQEYGIVNTDDPNINAVAWGIFASNPVALPAGIIFAATSLICYYSGAAFSMSLLALFPIPVIAVLIIADIYARMEPNTRESNNKRNTVGYAVLPLFAILSLVTLICLGKFHISITVPIYVQMASAILPAILVALSIMYFKYQMHDVAKSIEIREMWRANVNGLPEEAAYQKVLPTSYTYDPRQSEDPAPTP